MNDPGDRRARASFLHGAEILSKLHHSNVVRLIRSGAEGNQLFMVMEFIDGENLAELTSPEAIAKAKLAITTAQSDVINAQTTFVPINPFNGSVFYRLAIP